jgi:oxaloacetate decarboxylase (Na+ extruding) subunit gamma
MNEQFQEAFSLFGVGMVTVFIILLVVVLVGNSIIRVTNRFLPEKIVISAKEMGDGSGISKSKTAAIVAAIKVVTSGSGRIVKIEKK